ncbi:facilitated trehalose transporter Tret1-like isoform X2 [Homalodisca vitripennis]|uniref:facilitated trehalose transporter Tret1-like isoform X2 n=1 Tax=Homalodisca vitripennis TaxID=197043 RepID=UPI001EEC3366|nr:facilitated trehalose transporter Tret1-like isoform X2 [Homalodisca vitripennis]
MEETTYELSKTGGSRTNLYIAVFIANLGVFSTGFTLGWSSPSVVLLEAPDSRFPVTERQGAWLASLAPLGTAIGPFLSGWLLDFVGRRRTLMVYQLILLAGWGLMCVWSIWLMYVGRLLTGIALGGAMAATPVYVAEIATNSDRASVSSAFSLFMRIPLLVTFSIGPHISYHALILMSCVPIIGFLLLYPKMPESPHYSLLKKEEKESIKTLMWLRQMPEAAVLEEVKAIKALAKEERGQWKDLLTRKGNLKAVLILFSLHTFYQLSGGSVVIMCAQTIFNKTGISIRSDLCAVLIAAVMLTGTVVSPPIVSIWGYKKPLFGSVFGSAVSMGCFAYFNQQCENGIGTEFIQWAVVISLAAYIITNAAGHSPIPWALTGEFFPSSVKAKGATLSTVIFCGESFILINLFPQITAFFGLPNTCWIASINLFLGSIFVALCVPETSGLSFLQIQELLNK